MKARGAKMRAEANAVDAIDFASWAVDEAEAEALEAPEAQKIADALQPGTPSLAGWGVASLVAR